MLAGFKGKPGGTTTFLGGCLHKAVTFPFRTAALSVEPVFVANKTTSGVSVVFKHGEANNLTNPTCTGLPGCWIFGAALSCPYDPPDWRA